MGFILGIKRQAWSVSQVLILLPKRILRLTLHFLFFIPYNDKLSVKTIKDWVLDLPFYIIEILGVYEIYLVLNLLTFQKLRPLELEELIIVQETFPGILKTEEVWINSNAKLFTKKFAHAYVTGNIINFDGQLSESVFIHECVHLCQYQKFGLVYISRALRAQYSKEGYDYGGLFGIAKALSQGKKYKDFNFEQQAQIIEDYYEVKNRPDLLLNPFAVNNYEFIYRQMLETFR